MVMANLKPCPFCGKKPKLQTIEAFGYIYWYQCGDPEGNDHTVQGGVSNKKLEAKEHWNKLHG